MIILKGKNCERVYIEDKMISCDIVHIPDLEDFPINFCEINHHEIHKKMIINGLRYPLWEVYYHYKLPSFNSDDIIIDLGTNIGDFVITAIKLGAGKVISFEISKEAYNKAIENIKLEGVSEKCQLFNVAVWKSGVREETRYNSFEESHQTLQVRKDGDILVNNMGLDDILKDFDRVRFLKCDIEGSEYDVLQTCTTLQKINQMSIEVHRSNKNDERPEKLANFIENQGFDVIHELTGDKGLSFIYAKNKKWIQ